MTISRKTRSDSTAAFVIAAAKVRRPALEIPLHLTVRADAVPFWHAILAARARDEWGAADLAIAAQLAQVQCDIAKESNSLEQEGAVLDGKTNPRAIVLDMHSKRQLALMRTLRMGGVAGGGKPSTLANAGRLESAARRKLDDGDAHPLLA